MSVRAVSWAYGLNLGSMTQKAVLLYLAYRAREEDDCAWPSVNLIQGLDPAVGRFHRIV